MNKKLGMALASVSVAAIAVVAATSIGKTVKVFGTNDETWNHYSGVAASVFHNGSKEYWVSCSTHESVFAKPDVADTQIVDKGAPSREWIDSLEATDSRLIAKTGKVISFEDSSDLNYVVNGSRGCIASKFVNSTMATEGSKCLEIVTQASTTFSCAFLQSYMDEMFADLEVVAINFDMKATAEATKLSYQNSVTSPYEHDCCADNQVGFGLTLEWKTFSMTREMYNASKDKGITICTVGGQTPVGSSIYIDNIHPVAEKLTPLGFENSRLVKREGDWYSKTASFRNFDNKEIFVIGTGATSVDYGFDYDIKSEGNRSLRYEKVTQKWVTASMYNLGLKAGDTVTFDVRFSIAINGDVAFIMGDGTGFGKIFNANTWYTLSVPYEHFKDGTALFGFNGSPACSFYVDNLRIN